MKKILIFGLKEPVGGIENIIMSYAKRFPLEQIVCHFIIFGNGFYYEDEINSMGGKVFYLPNRIRHPFEYRKKLKSIFAQNDYTAVWANFTGLTNIDVLKLGKKFQVPIRIAHSHVARLFWEGPIMRLLVPLFHKKNKLKIDNYATHFWACSELAGKFMFPLSTHPKLEIINNAIDTHRFYVNKATGNKIRKELNLENSFVICHVARMAEEKNQEFMLEVFEQVLKLKQNAKLIFVGEGNLKEQLIEKAHALGISDSVLFIGFKNNVEDFYNAADLFLLPSLAEGLGMGLIEAQACGVPCVASTAVPNETNITGCVKFVDLNASKQQWCDAIINTAQLKISDPKAAVKNAGFDLSLEAKKLTDFFIKGEF